MKWVSAKERLPGIYKVVEWRNGEGGNIPLGKNTFLDQYAKVGPNTSWHEWLDESERTAEGYAVAFADWIDYDGWWCEDKKWSRTSADWENLSTAELYNLYSQEQLK